MADASDSKSDVGDYVWVQVPSPAFDSVKLDITVQGLRFFCNHNKEEKEKGNAVQNIRKNRT